MLERGEVRSGLNMGNKGGEVRGGNVKSKVRLPGCTEVSLPPFLCICTCVVLHHFLYKC